MLKRYVGVKLVDAEPMNLGEYNKMRGWKIPEDENPKEEGYKIMYPDGYVSWSPKEIFEKFYMQVGSNNTVTQELVDSFIKDVEVFTLGAKTTVVNATMINGFNIVASSACVDISNYNEQIGKEICLEHIKNDLWKLLGFVLQTGFNGLNK